MKRTYYNDIVVSWHHWMELKFQGYTDVNGDVYFGNQRLTSLEGSPITCRDFYCSYNELTSLKGAPVETRDFHCEHNQLTSLEYHPEIFSFINAKNNPLVISDPYVIMLLLQEKLVI